MNTDPQPNPVQVPAIILIIVGGLNALLGVLSVVSGILVALNPPETPVFNSKAEEVGYYMGQNGVAVIGLLSLIISPLIIYGAVKMLKGASQSWARASAILAMIPLTSCCCLFGLPVGVWVLIILTKPDVKMFFDQGGTSYNPPPPPPQYYQPM